MQMKNLAEGTFLSEMLISENHNVVYDIAKKKITQHTTEYTSDNTSHIQTSSSI